MAALKKSEARLLIMFGILIFGAVTFFVLDIVKGKKNRVLVRQRAMEKEIGDLEKLIDTKPKWEYYRDFVQQYQPVYRSEEQEAPALESYFRRAAGGLEIKKLLPNPPLPMEGNMISISLQANVRGTGNEVLAFLSVLQAENRFYAIPSIAIVADRKDPSIVNVDMIFARWFTQDGEIQEPTETSPTPEFSGTVAARPAAEPEEKPSIVPPSTPAKLPGLITDPATTTTQNENDKIKLPVTPVAAKKDEATAESETN